ncbi:hypothetical protein AB0K09_04160 [Streptomyces sp. NPDC049577]|uniref:hypothetical protein n=1 Tax=Streptomyces sp. NPDC049577 TaxID=3155153 RepID=UPI00342120DA
MSAHPIDRPPQALSALMVQRDNAIAVDVLRDYTDLPAPTIVPRPYGVHVIVADIEELGDWLIERGGEIRISPQYDDVEVWTLHTATPALPDGSGAVVVRVSVVLPTGERVRDEIRAAVGRTVPSRHEVGGEE